MPIAKMYDYNGEPKTLREISEITGIGIKTLRGRIHRGIEPPMLFEMNRLESSRSSKANPIARPCLCFVVKKDTPLDKYKFEEMFKSTTKANIFAKKLLDCGAYSVSVIYKSRLQ